MSQFVVFDIETYGQDWRKRLPRRQALDPNKNSIITVGFFNGNEMSIYPVIEDLKKENRPLEFFLNKLNEIEGHTIVGFNIFKFDLPYLFFKAKAFGKDIDLTRLKFLDLYWILPYWLHNLPNGIDFFRKSFGLGNLWSLEKVVRYILQGESNPFSNIEILKLWEKRQFEDIKKHLELDLHNTFSFFKSSVIQEALRQIKLSNLYKENCEESCPYKSFLSISSGQAICYCTITQDIIQEKRNLSPIDIIDFPLPRRDISWKPPCLEYRLNR